MLTRVRSTLVIASLALITVAALPTTPAGAAAGHILGAVKSPSWQTNAPVRGIGYANGLAYVGGEFTSVRPPGAPLGTGEVARTSLAAFDAATGELVTSFDHTFDDLVNVITPSPDGSTIYVGGKFTTVDGVQRKRLAAFDTATGELLDWAPLAGNPVLAIATSGTTVYVGGSFNAVNGQPRTRLAAVDEDGTLLGWNPTASATVQTMAVTPDGSKVVIGGYFDQLNGANIHAIGWVDATTGATQTWNSNILPICSVVKNVTTDANTIYVAAEGTGSGCFDGSFAADATTSNLKWRNDCLGATQAILRIGDYVYKGSHQYRCPNGDPSGFPSTTQPRYHLLAQNVDDGQIEHWFPNTNGVPLGPKAFGTDGRRLFVGGDFTTVNGKPQQGFTIFDALPANNFKPRRPATPIATSTNVGKVKVTFGTVVDDDDATLTYQVFRDGSASPVGEIAASSKPWAKPSVTFTDTGVTPGDQHSYKVRATDGALFGAKSPPSNTVTVSATDLSYRDTVLSDSPFLYWRLGDTGGSSTATDSSGNGRTGRYENGVTKGITPGAIAGDSDPAAGFDGTNDLVRSSSQISSPGPQIFSVEAWFKTTTTRGGKIIGFGNLATGTSSNYDRHIYMTNTGQLVFGVYLGATRTVQSSASYNDGQWHQVVGTVSPGGMTLYVDGAAVGSNPSGNAGQSYAGYWRLGGDNLDSWPSKPTSPFFNGQIDEFSVYSQALTAVQVADHYSAGT